MNKVAVIDYGMGNLHSVAKAVEYVSNRDGLSVDVSVTSDPAVIEAADRVIFPGVGAIRDCMAEIRRLRIDEIVANVAETKPMLAICVGFQALQTFSEENEGVECLGYFQGTVRFFGRNLHDQQGERLKVPHMGWNCVKQNDQHPLWRDVPDNSRFYFVHSYYVEPHKNEKVSGVTHYGVDFAASMAKGKVFAVQFHPEKSQDVGITLLANFLKWDGSQ